MLILPNSYNDFLTVLSFKMVRKTFLLHRATMWNSILMQFEALYGLSALEATFKFFITNSEW